MKTMQIPSCAHCENNNKLFCGMSDDDREQLSENKKAVLYKKGQAIFHEGQQAFGLFCIYKGNVKITKMGADGKELIVRFIKKGESLGYRALLSNTPYNTSATAIENCEICFISKKAFFNKMDENKLLNNNAIQLLSEKLKESEDHLVMLTHNSQRERVAEALLLLKTKFGTEDDKKTLKVSLTRREIAEIAGITTESTIRTLSALKKEDILELVKKQIRIIDNNRLVAIAKNNY